MAHFTVENLQKERLGEAWPVVQTSGLEANLDWWLTDAARLIDRGGGVLVARAPDGSIHGVATYGRAVSRPRQESSRSTCCSPSNSTGVRRQGAHCPRRWRRPQRPSIPPASPSRLVQALRE